MSDGFKCLNDASDQILFKFDLFRVNYTFYCTQKKKSRSVRSGDLAGHRSTPSDLFTAESFNQMIASAAKYAEAQLD